MEPLTFTLLVLLLISLLFSGAAWRARSQALLRDHEKSLFLAMVSHDIRSTMTAVLSSIELLQQRPFAGEDRKILSVASTASYALLELLEGLLDLSKLEARRLELAPTPCDPHTLIQSAVDIVSTKATPKDLPIHVCVTMPEHTLMVVDGMRVRQILINVLSNAVKFTDQGSVTLKAFVHNNELRVSVIDTGMGISPETQKTLFNPYVQADSKTAHRYGGTGLGLVICRELAQAMGGSITLESQLGIGTTVSFAIPCTLVASSPAPRTQAITQATAPALPSTQSLEHRGSPLKILVVEDIAVNRFVIERQLKAINTLPFMAESGPMALEMLKKERVDLILMDCYMPDMDGYATTRSVREQERATQRSPTPIIAISAASDTEHKQKCKDSGMNDVLQKPLQLEALKHMIHQWCRESEPTDQSLRPLEGDNLQRLIEQSIKTDLHAMQEAKRGRDIDALNHLAHRIKGMEVMFQGQEINDLATYLEDALKDPQAIVWEEVDDLIEAMEDVLHR